jgi:16S rRNA processing protein RimM
VQLVVGRIGKAHGIHGELSVDVRTDDPERRFAAGVSIETDPPEHGPLTVLRARPHSGRLLVTFDGVEDRTTAEALRGILLVVDSSTSPPVEDPEEFWDHDLVGLTVETTAGERVGEISEILHVPGQDLLAVNRESGEELLIPFVASIVPSVDLAGGRVLIEPPPGLLTDEEA